LFLQIVDEKTMPATRYVMHRGEDHKPEWREAAAGAVPFMLWSLAIQKRMPASNRSFDVAQGNLPLGNSRCNH
jgi:hypothetical protein